MTERTRKALFASGWSEQRVVDITESARVLLEEGYDLFPLAEKIVMSLEGITIQNAIDFYCEDGQGLFGSLKSWMELNKIQLFPIGMNGHINLYIGRDGHLYGDDGLVICRIGDDFWDGVDQVLFRDGSGRWVAVTPRLK